MTEREKQGINTRRKQAKMKETTSTLTKIGAQLNQNSCGENGNEKREDK